VVFARSDDSRSMRAPGPSVARCSFCPHLRNDFAQLQGHLHNSVVLGPGSVVILENVFLRHGQGLEASSILCSLCTRLAIVSRSLTMLINNKLSAKRMLRYALGCLAICAVGAQVDSGCTTHLIVDSDIFSDVEYVSTVIVTFSTRTGHLTCLRQ
jgi:hypothetical protein